MNNHDKAKGALNVKHTSQKSTPSRSRKVLTNNTKSVTSKKTISIEGKKELHKSLPISSGKKVSIPVQSSPQSYQIKNAPITPEKAIQIYNKCLTKYEKEEILNYNEIYFIGNPMRKIAPDVSNGNSNYNFDFPTKRYKANISDHINYRYEIKSVLGTGAFGVVLKCYDHKEKNNIAIKIINNEEQIKKQSLKEFDILKSLNEKNINNNIPILKIFDLFEFRGHICLTFELLGTNLYEYCKLNSFKPLSLRQVKIISKQMFSALKFIHENGITHCDLKLENVLFSLGSTEKIRLIDFGTACRNDDEHFNYIQSRYYRAPEVILGLPYGNEIDIWSVGCIIAELIKGSPMFPGENEIEQLQLFMNILGEPPFSLISKSPRKDHFFNRPLRGKENTYKIKSSLIAKSTKITNTNLLDLLTKCFEYEPEKRITAENTLKHPFFNSK